MEICPKHNNYNLTNNKMTINRKTFYIIIIILVSIFSYFTTTVAENTYKSSTNIDKYIRVSSVTYIPNGNQGALCQIVCFDNKGLEYHIINSDRHFVGDVIKYYEHNERPYIYIMSIFISLLLLIIIFTICFTVMALLNFNIFELTLL